MWISKYSNLVSFVVGITFCFSGVIKLNDPRSFAHKIEEYVHLGANRITSHMRLLLTHTRVLAIWMATLEFVLGVALLTRWESHWTLRILLILTLFFTFLTLYTATSKRLASCGCFGDALVLTPWQSFAKSMVLLLLISGLCWQGTSGLANLNSHYWMMAALLFSLGLSKHTLKYLPVIDFSPYKVGNNLSKLIRLQEPDYKLVPEKLSNPDGVSLGVSFRIWKGDKDCTNSLLEGKKLLIMIQNPVSITAPTLKKLCILIEQLEKAIQPVLLVPGNQGQEIATSLGLPRYKANLLLLQDMLRAPWGLILLKEGVVTSKWGSSELIKARKTLKDMGWLRQ